MQSLKVSKRDSFDFSIMKELTSSMSSELPIRNDSFDMSSVVSVISEIPIRDQIVLTNIKQRDFCTESFTTLFKNYNVNYPETIFKNYLKIGKNVERSIYNETLSQCKINNVPLTWESPDFIDQYKRIYFKVKCNLTITPNAPQVIRRLIAKEILPTDVASMTHRQLDPDTWKKYEDEYQASLFRDIAPTERKGFFQCGKCQSYNTEYRSMQTRSADEPMTNFHSCLNCGKKWKS